MLDGLYGEEPEMMIAIKPQSLIDLILKYIVRWNDVFKGWKRNIRLQGPTVKTIKTLYSYDYECILVVFLIFLKYILLGQEYNLFYNILTFRFDLLALSLDKGSMLSKLKNAEKLVHISYLILI